MLLDETLDADRSFDIRLEIIGGLMDILRIKDIDVVILNQAPPGFALSRLARRRAPVLPRPHVRVEFTARTVSAYLDFKPVIERHERAILERARKGELLHGYNPHRGALERYRRLRERFAQYISE